MSDGKKSNHVGARIIKAIDALKPVNKSDKSEIIEESNGTLWKEPPIPIQSLREMVMHSTILPQCIRAYKDNIAGFGLGVKYIEDVQDETPEQTAEFTKLEGILDLLNMDMNTKEVFEDLIEGREEAGISYLEVMRNLEGEVNQIEYIKKPETIKMTARLEPPVEVEYFYKGTSVKRPKKFRKFKQEINGKVVYFKEFGDPRVMNKKNGNYEENTPLDERANEIMDFTIGTDDYGCVRWSGQILTVDGSRRAENLNNNYFINGRHTPMAIVVSGGTLSDESFTKLQDYMNGIRGENGQHAFLVLEVEDSDNKTAIDADQQPKVEIKDLAAILQKDELFQDYIENGRKKTQSAFRLPDLYTGYTTEFNRATAQTAMEVTEEQVFQPERASLAWAINHRLLNGYQFKHVEAYFKAPNISNPDDLFKILTVAEKAGGVTPDMAHEIAMEATGKKSEPYDGDWGKTPLAVQNAINTQQSNDLAREQMKYNQANSAKQKEEEQNNLDEQLKETIQKAEGNRDDEVVAVMKEVRKLLKQMQVQKKAGV